MIMSNLFSPLDIKNITLKNRIVVSPMCQYSSFDGFANDWHLVHLGSRAVGGAGLIIFEATAVSPEGRISPGDLGIWKDDHIPMLKRITEFITSQDAVPGIQLAHAGRKASHHVPWQGGNPLSTEDGAWQTAAPSPIAFKEDDNLPVELSIDEIQKVINDFKSAAKRSLDAGFKIIEIHAAHGYLVHEFYSPFSNKRTDDYGGAFNNRIRLLLEIIDNVREVWPVENPLFVRISATDWIEDGWTIEDSVRLARILKDHHVDLVDCSTGGNVPGVKIPVGPCYQLPFAEKIKKESGIMTGAVGMITTATEAESIITNQQADIVLLAREFLRDPYFPLHAADELNVEQNWPLQYLRAKPKK